jgi:hypothetical protein
MKSRHLLPAVALTFAVGGLSACNPAGATGPGSPPSAVASSPSSSATPSPSPTPTPTPTKKPVDPRTAAVTKAVDRYYKVTDALYRKPNRAPWRKLKTVSRDEAFFMRQDELLDMFTSQQHATGSTTWKTVRVGKIQKKTGHLRAHVTTCWDVSAVDVVDKHGKSVINKKKRPNRGSAALTLRLDGKTWYVVRDWDGNAKC